MHAKRILKKFFFSGSAKVQYPDYFSLLVVIHEVVSGPSFQLLNVRIFFFFYIKVTEQRGSGSSYKLFFFLLGGQGELKVLGLGSSYQLFSFVFISTSGSLKEKIVTPIRSPITSKCSLGVPMQITIWFTTGRGLSFLLRQHSLVTTGKINRGAHRSTPARGVSERVTLGVGFWLIFSL